MGNCAAKSDPHASCRDKDGNAIRAGNFLTMAEYTGYGDNRVRGDGNYVAGMVNPKKQTLAYSLRDPTNAPQHTLGVTRPPDLAGKSPCDEWLVKYSKGTTARIGSAQPASPTSGYSNLEEAVTAIEACVVGQDYAGATRIIDDALHKCEIQAAGFDDVFAGGPDLHREKVILLNTFLRESMQKAKQQRVLARNANQRKQRHTGKAGGGRSKKKRTKNKRTKRTKNKRTKRTKNKRKNRTYKNKGR